MITLTNILNETSRAVLKVIQGPLAGFSYKSWSVRMQLMYESNPRVPMPPSRADPRAFDIIFGQIPHHACGPFLWSNAPLPGP